MQKRKKSKRGNLFTKNGKKISNFYYYCKPSKNKTRKMMKNDTRTVCPKVNNFLLFWNDDGVKNYYRSMEKITSQENNNHIYETYKNQTLISKKKKTKLYILNWRHYLTIYH